MCRDFKHILVIVLTFPLLGIAGCNLTDETLNPKIVLPAIESSRLSLLKDIQEYADLEAGLEPGQVVVSFNPYAQSPGDAEIPDSAGDFKFWEIKNPDSYSTFLGFLQSELSLLHYETPINFGRIPPGYGVVRYVLGFQSDLRFSGWLAIENVGPDEMIDIRNYYRLLGLSAEADALEKAEAAWYAADGTEGDGAGAAGEAYSSIENPYRDDEDRWSFIAETLRAKSWWVKGT